MPMHMLINPPHLNKPWAAALGLLALRLSVGATFIVHGLPKLQNTAATVAFFERIGIPAPQFFAPFVGVVETVGGILLILGLLTRFWGAGLVIDMVVAILAAKGLASFKGYEFELLLAASSLLLFLQGGGRWAVDAWLVKRLRK